MNKSNYYAILSKLAFLIAITIFPLTIQSEVNASGKIVIRKTPGAGVKVQTPDSPGFDAKWTFPTELKKPVRVNISSSQIRQSANKDVPENPVEVETPANNDPHFTGYYQLSDDALLINVSPKTKSEGRVMLPIPANYDLNYYPTEVFLNGEARRIVVWNGKDDDSGEQLLICSDDLRSATGQSEAVLSVMPLPGKPIEIYRAKDCFDALHDSLTQKINFPKDPYNPDPVVWNGRITPYCLQSFEFKNVDEFFAAANAMVYTLYGDSAQMQVRKKQFQAIQYLFEKKYSWYAFDVSLLRNWGTVTEPIAYRTKAKSICVPLLDGRIGGADEGTVMKVIAITPDKAEIFDGLTYDKDVLHVGKKTAIFTIAELNELCPDVAEFCKQHKMEKVLVREFIAQNRIAQYPGDFKMRKAMPKPKNEVTPVVVDPNQPGQPGANQPGQRGANQPGQPGANQPGQRGANQPGQRGANQPGQRGVKQPGQPGANQPGQPGANQPGQPGANQPGTNQPSSRRQPANSYPNRYNGRWF